MTALTMKVEEPGMELLNDFPDLAGVTKGDIRGRLRIRDRFEELKSLGNNIRLLSCLR